MSRQISEVVRQPGVYVVSKDGVQGVLRSSSPAVQTHQFSAFIRGKLYLFRALVTDDQVEGLSPLDRFERWVVSKLPALPEVANG